MVVPLLDDGAEVLAVDPEFDEDGSDDDVLDDELEDDALDGVPEVDVAAFDEVAVAWPAYVCSASTPRPPAASTALATVDSSTRKRSRSARSRRATGVSGACCECGCEALVLM